MKLDFYRGKVENVRVVYTTLGFERCSGRVGLIQFTPAPTTFPVTCSFWHFFAKILEKKIRKIQDFDSHPDHTLQPVVIPNMHISDFEKQTLEGSLNF